MYKDNDDGMMWGTNSISVTPILNETHHIDQTIYNRLQWLAGLMQDSEPGSEPKIKDYFVNVVHISGDNYDKLKASVLKQAASLKSRVGLKDIQLDLDFEGTMKKLYAKEIQALATAPTMQRNRTSDLNATARAQEITEHTAPNGTVELATRPSTFPGHPEIYSKRTTKRKRNLLQIDFYNGKTKDGLDIVLDSEDL